MGLQCHNTVTTAANEDVIADKELITVRFGGGVILSTGIFVLFKQKQNGL